MENVVPIVIAAKHLFEKEHDPLLKNLLLYLKELMQVRKRTTTNQPWIQYPGYECDHVIIM